MGNNHNSRYYHDRWIVVTYSPEQDKYVFLINSTKCRGRTRLLLDQRLVEEFSANSVDHLSDKLPLLGEDHELSRTDVERFHKAISGTMERFLKNLQDFKKKESL